VSIETTSAAKSRKSDSTEEGSEDRSIKDTAAQVARLADDLAGARIAVLVRTNLSVAKLIFHLRQLGVAASELGGNPLTDSAAVQLVLSLLKLSDHPGDRCSAYLLAASPWSSQLGIQNGWDDATARQVSRAAREVLAEAGYGRAVQLWADQLRPACDLRQWRRLCQLVELAYRHQQKIERPVTIGYTSQQRVSLRASEFIQTVATERIADPSESRIQVMTVHQSKGLQFDVVVLTELDRRLRGQTPQCVARRPTPFDRVDLVTRYIASEHRDFFPAEIREVHHAYERDDMREELCVLYVAVTRAIHALHVFMTPAKNINMTADGLIQAAFGLTPPFEPNTVLYQAGDARWHTAGDRGLETSVEPLAEAGSVVRPAIRLRAPDAIHRRSVETISPSHREGGTLVRLGDRLIAEGSEALRYGTVIHAWFEQIIWLETSRVEPESLRRIAKHEGLSDDATDRAIRRFQTMLAFPEVEELLSERRYRGSSRFARLHCGTDAIHIDVRNEQPIAGRTEEGLMSGIVDRLLVFRDSLGQPIAADIIDFKTDTFDRDDRSAVASKVEFYRPQLSAYRDAIRQMLRLAPERVRACLAFVGQGIVREVD
jgi:ATP-dependent exoDNAse (exonuclease V) beta subunit